MHTGQWQPITGTPTEVPVPSRVAVTGVVLTEGKAAARMRFEVRLSDEDEELATEKIHEGRGANQHELGEDAGKSEPPDEEWSSQEADQEAEPGNGSEEGEFGGSGMASGDEDEAGVEEVADLIGEGKGDQVVDDEISLPLGIGDRLALDGRPVHGRDHGVGEGHGDGQEDDGAGDPAEAVLHELHENRSVVGLKPAFESILAGNSHIGGQQRLNRGTMIA